MSCNIGISIFLDILCSAKPGIFSSKCYLHRHTAQTKWYHRLIFFSDNLLTFLLMNSIAMSGTSWNFSMTGFTPCSQLFFLAGLHIFFCLNTQCHQTVLHLSFSTPSNHSYLKLLDVWRLITHFSSVLFIRRSKSERSLLEKSFLGLLLVIIIVWLLQKLNR